MNQRKWLWDVIRWLAFCLLLAWEARVIARMIEEQGYGPATPLKVLLCMCPAFLLLIAWLYEIEMNSKTPGGGKDKPFISRIVKWIEWLVR